MDASRHAVVLGPFRTEAGCRQWAYREPQDGGDPAKCARLRKVAEQRDPRSWFYAWGMVRCETGHREGCLNSTMEKLEAIDFA
jgi:hypothetical protein